MIMRIVITDPTEAVLDAYTAIRDAEYAVIPASPDVVEAGRDAFGRAVLAALASGHKAIVEVHTSPEPT